MYVESFLHVNFVLSYYRFPDACLRIQDFSDPAYPMRGNRIHVVGIDFTSGHSFACSSIPDMIVFRLTDSEKFFI